MKLTKRVVESVAPVAAEEVFLWDEDLPGFGLRVFPSGKRGYLIQYRAKGRTRRVALGLHGVLTPDEARRRARVLLAEAANGGDPAEERRRRREGATVAELAKRYMREHAEPKKKPSSVASDQRLLDAHILPAFRARRVEDVSRADVTRLHHAMRETPIEANRTVALLSKMFTLAERWGWRPDGSNPCRHVERFRERKRERFLSSKELALLGDVLTTMEREYRAQNENDELAKPWRGHRGYRPTDRVPPAPVSPTVAAAVRLLVLTGCRRGEILGLSWEHVDFERRCLRLPDSKTGAKTIQLAAPALQVLGSLTQGKPTEWVFQAPDGEGPVSLARPWKRIVKRAGLDGLRIHDLRHSFASVAAANGTSLLLIGKMLGHTVPATTARYAHLADDPVREAAEQTAARIAAAMSAHPDAQMVPLHAATRAGGAA